MVFGSAAKMFTSKLVVLLLCVFVFANGYGLSERNSSTTLSRLQPDNKASNSNSRTTTASPKSMKIDSMQLQLEILELQRMQKSLLSDMATGQTSSRKQRLLNEIEQQIEVRRNRRKQLQTTEAPIVHTTSRLNNKASRNTEVEKPQVTDAPADNRQEQDTSQNRQQSVQRQTQNQQMIQAPPPPIQPVQNQQQQTNQLVNQNVQLVRAPQPIQQSPQQPNNVMQMVPAPNQNMQEPIKNVQFFGSQHQQQRSASNQNIQQSNNNNQFAGAQQQQVNQQAQMAQAQQFMPSLQIPPLMPQHFMSPQFMQPPSINLSAPGNGIMPMQHFMMQMNPFSLNSMLNGQNNRYMVLDNGSGNNVGDKSVQMAEFAPKKSPPKPPTTVSPTVATTIPTTTTTVATTTTKKRPTTSKPTPPTTVLSPSDMLDMDVVKMSYYEDSITKQKLEIQKLRLEVRALQREERQNMMGENENEDGPRRRGGGGMFDPRSMFGPRQMPPFMSMFR